MAFALPSDLSGKQRVPWSLRTGSSPSSVERAEFACSFGTPAEVHVSEPSSAIG